MKTTVLIADDHQVVIDGLTSLIGKLKDFEVAFTAKNGNEVLDYLSSNDTPDILLMDISMPKMDGVTTMEKIKESGKLPKVIILTMHLSGAYARKLLDMGAKGYLQKDCDKKELHQALLDVRDGGTYLSSNMMDLLFKERNQLKKDRSVINIKISDRQKEILDLLLIEHSSREISSILGISFNTVETHRKHLLNKFKVKTTVGLIREALRAGILK